MLNTFHLSPRSTGNFYFLVQPREFWKLQNHPYFTFFFPGPLEQRRRHLAVVSRPLFAAPPRGTVLPPPRVAPSPYPCSTAFAGAPLQHHAAQNLSPAAGRRGFHVPTAGFCPRPLANLSPTPRPYLIHSSLYKAPAGPYLRKLTRTWSTYVSSIQLALRRM